MGSLTPHTPNIWIKKSPSYVFIHNTKSNVCNSPSLGLDWLLSSKLLPGLGTQQNPGLHHAVYLSNEIWALDTVSHALPQTPHPSAENNQSRKIKVLGKLKMGTCWGLTRGSRAELQLFYWLGISAWGRDWAKKCICHVKAGVAYKQPHRLLRVASRMEITVVVAADHSNFWTDRCSWLVGLVTEPSCRPTAPPLTFAENSVNNNYHNNGNST